MTGHNQELFKLFNNMSNIVPWNAQVNDSNFKKAVLWWLLQLAATSCNSKAFSEESFIVKELVLLLTPIQPKINALKISYYASHCANEYVKEKETTILTKYHGELLTIMSDCLFNSMLVY